jgi:hypothetical protein
MRRTGLNDTASLLGAAAYQNGRAPNAPSDYVLACPLNHSPISAAHLEPFGRAAGSEKAIDHALDHLSLDRPAAANFAALRRSPSASWGVCIGSVPSTPLAYG